jgi:hypothetical protein
MTRSAEERRQYIYDDKTLVAVIEPLDGRWRVIVRGGEIGTFDSRAAAMQAIDEHGGSR